FLYRIFLGFLSFAFRLRLPPLATSPSCCSDHRCSVLVPSLPAIRITIQARSPKLFGTHLLFQPRQNSQSFAALQGARIFLFFAYLLQIHCESSPRLAGGGVALVRRAQAG